MKKNIAISLNKNAELAAQDIKKQFSNIDNIFCIMFFASYIYDANKLASAMKEQFPNIECFGAESNREISPDGISNGSLVAFAFTSDLIEDFHIEVVENLSSNDLDIQPILTKFADHYKQPLRNLDPKKYYGLVFIDFVSRAEEKLFNEIGNYTNVVFLGATASDDWMFSKTGIYANGKYYRDAAVISLFKSKKQFSFKKIESVVEIGGPLEVTKSDISNKILYEINHRPAAEVYCEINGLDYNTISKGPLNKHIADEYLLHPLAIKSDDEIYLRVVHWINESDKSLTMGCNIHEGLDVYFYRACDDILEHTKTKVKKMLEKYNNINYCFSFVCSIRYINITKTNKLAEYNNIYKQLNNTIGFYCFGEYYTAPVNNTATILILFDK